MGKVAIVTILSNNLGNRLQNYALQEILISQGHIVETVQKGNKNSEFSRSAKYYIKKILKTKDWKFRDFDRKIKWSPYSLSIQNDKNKMAQEYDFFIAGSDQVWNPNFGGTNADSFLSFVPEEKRIAYAASFGVDEIPNDLMEKYGDYLQKFASISVREKQAVKMVEQYEGCHAKWVLDPTLLLQRKKWNQLAVTPKIREKYVVKYLLGEEQSDCNNLINRTVGNVKVIDVKKLLEGEGTGPGEFLGLVKNAELICTDSFHAAVFSTIFEKPFVIFERMDEEKDMSSRLDSLCEILELSDHRYASANFEISKIMKPNYKKTSILLEKERKKSLEYLTNALNN